MQRKTKIIFNKISKMLIFLAMVGCIVWINAAKLQDDTLSNYEKITDTGVRDYYGDPISPVIAALFYKDENAKVGFMSFDKSDLNGKDRNPENIKMSVVPKNVTSFNRPVIEKLYDEIPQKHKIKNIVVVYTDGKNAKEHINLINKKFSRTKITKVLVNQENELKEKEIDEYLKNDGTIIVFLANLDRGLNTEKSERLANEAVFFAQKNNYQMNVFDIVDEYVASALESGDDFAYMLSNKSSTDSLAKQKENLDRFALRNRGEILQYFIYNLEQARNKKKVALPKKNNENYRLFDRGTVYIKVYNKEYAQVFEELKLNQDEGIIAVISNMAKDIMNSSKGETGKYFKIYLLTEMELINAENPTVLLNYLEANDGIYVSYKKQAGLLLATDRPGDPFAMVEKLRAIAQIKDNVKDSDLTFYRFKYAEIQYEN